MPQSNKRNEPWRANERHYCAICNTWMGSDRQSILIHENGKKHRENVEANLIKRREGKAQTEKDEQNLASTLKKMEEAAAAAVYCARVPNQAVSTAAASTTTSTATSIVNPNCTVEKKDINSWRDRKEKRKISEVTADIDNDRTEKKKRALNLGPDEGHYTIGNMTYLEGQTYAPLFEEDMVVQLFSGSSTMSLEYQKSPDAQQLWKNGIILKVRSTKTKPKKSATSKENDLLEDQDIIKCHVSFLNNDDDEDETIEKDVDVKGLRLILGSDELTPETVEEARLRLAGGEEITTINNEINEMNGNKEPEIDENTGLSSWGTVSVKKVAISHEVKQERERIRRKKREEKEKEEMKAREAEGRRMEEAKHANADDSALGAYDVWSTSKKGGYKGVKIHANAKLAPSDTAKSLSNGKLGIKFKKNGGSGFKKSKKKQNRRKAFDDDDE